MKAKLYPTYNKKTFVFDDEAKLLIALEMHQIISNPEYKYGFCRAFNNVLLFDFQVKMKERDEMFDEFKELQAYCPKIVNYIISWNEETYIMRAVWWFPACSDGEHHRRTRLDILDKVIDKLTEKIWKTKNK